MLTAPQPVGNIVIDIPIINATNPNEQPHPTLEEPKAPWWKQGITALFCIVAAGTFGLVSYGVTKLLCGESSEDSKEDGNKHHSNADQNSVQNKLDESKKSTALVKQSTAVKTSAFDPYSGVVSVANLDVSTGFPIDGDIPSPCVGFGTAISAAHDVWGQNGASVVIGDQCALDGKGQVSVVFGPFDKIPHPINIGSLIGTNGFKVRGEAPNGNAFGIAVAAGDVNSDGHDDILIGDTQAARVLPASQRYGKAYVLYGKNANETYPSLVPNPFTSTSVGQSAIGDYCFSELGLGNTVAFSPNFNRPTVATGAYSACNNLGKVALLFGPSGWQDPEIATALNGSIGTWITGVTTSSLGVATAFGDVNNDNLDDLVVTAPQESPSSPPAAPRNQAGAIYLIFGKTGIWPNPNYIDAWSNHTNLVKYYGETANDRLGSFVNAAHDINGDNINDVVTGTTFANGGNGMAYVIYGQPAFQFRLNSDIATLNGTNGFKIYGNGNGFGASCSTGDINNDGFPDLIFGTPNAQNNTGAAIVIWGKNNWPATVNIAGLSSTDSLTVWGANPGDKFGTAVTVGDFNNDGIPDLLAAAPGFNNSTGRVYGIYGFYGKITMLRNTLAIGDGETVALNSANIEIIDPNVGVQPTAVTVDETVNGHFEDNEGNTLANFTQNAIANGTLVRFKHDGNNLPPQITLRAFNDKTYSSSSNSTVAFNYRPIISTNRLFLNSSSVALVKMAVDMLSAYDLNDPNGTLTFVIPGPITHGFFSYVEDIVTEILGFTQSDIGNNRVYFNYDQSGRFPSYSIQVHDPKNSTSLPQQAEIICSFCTAEPSSTASSTDIGAIAGGSAAGVVLLVGAIVLIALRKRICKPNKDDTKAELTPYAANNTVKIGDTIVSVPEINFCDLVMGKKLGSGGCGTVYQATWENNTTVAVKQLNAIGGLTPTDLNYFAREVAIMDKLRHPNVAIIYGICVTPTYCIVMEYMAMGSLDNYFLNLSNNIPLEVMLKMASDCSKGLAHLHKNKIIHRDVKLANFLIATDKNGKFVVKIADFGTSRVNVNDSSQTAVEFIGSTDYMAPELFTDAQRVYSFPADVFSFGMSLWGLLTRQPTYQGFTRFGIEESVAHGNRLPIPEKATITAKSTVVDSKTKQTTFIEPTEVAYPKKFAELITFCWLQDPTKRPPMTYVVQELDEMHKAAETSNNSSLR
jgi:hypothetical protein